MIFEGNEAMQRREGAVVDASLDPIERYNADSDEYKHRDEPSGAIVDAVAVKIEQDAS